MAKGVLPVFVAACGVIVAGIAGYLFIERGEINSTKTENPESAISESVKTENPESANSENSESQNSESVNPENPESGNSDSANSENAESENSENVEIAKVDPAQEQTDETPKAESAETETPEAPKVESAESEKSADPEFDLVRVERDGSTVIAGTAEANSTIQIMDKNEVIAESKTNSTGEYVIVLDQPLASGEHELFVVSKPENGEATQSAATAFISVPEANSENQVTVLLSEAGKATRVLQKPEPVETPKAEPEETEVAAVTPEENSENATSASEDTVSATSEESVSLAKPEEENPEIAKPEIEPAPIPVLIEAADIEGEKLFIAGTGEPGAELNIYVDNQLLGSAQIAENGAFLFEGVKKLEPGRYDIRADMLKADSSDVSARAEVSLLHEPVVEPEVEVAEAEKPNEPVAVSQPAQTESDNSTEEATEEQLAAQAPEPESAADEEPKTETAEEAPQPATETEVTETQQSENPETATSESANESEPVTAESETEPTANTAETEVVKTESEETQTAAATVETTSQTATQKKEIKTGSAVIIRRGDNLWTVARRNYGAGIKYTTIFEANRDQVRNPHLIYPGQVLKVPEDEDANSQPDQG